MKFLKFTGMKLEYGLWFCFIKIYIYLQSFFTNILIVQIFLTDSSLKIFLPHILYLDTNPHTWLCTDFEGCFSSGNADSIVGALVCFYIKHKYMCYTPTTLPKGVHFYYFYDLRLTYPDSRPLTDHQDQGLCVNIVLPMLSGQPYMSISCPDLLKKLAISSAEFDFLRTSHSRYGSSLL